MQLKLSVEEVLTNLRSEPILFVGTREISEKLETEGLVIVQNRSNTV